MPYIFLIQKGIIKWSYERESELKILIPMLIRRSIYHLKDHQ